MIKSFHKGCIAISASMCAAHIRVDNPVCSWEFRLYQQISARLFINFHTSFSYPFRHTDHTVANASIAANTIVPSTYPVVLTHKSANRQPIICPMFSDQDHICWLMLPFCFFVSPIEYKTPFPHPDR